MSNKRDLPKSLQTPSDPSPPVVLPDAAGVSVEYKRPAPEAGGATPDVSPAEGEDAASESVAIPRQPEVPLPELSTGQVRLPSGVIRSDADGVQISSRPANGVPLTFPTVPSKVETLRNGIVRSTM